MFLQELSWQQFSNLPNIKKMPIYEQQRQFRIYLYEVNVERLAYAQQQQNMASMDLMGGGGSTQSSPGGSGTIVFNGLDPQSGGSYVLAPKATITTWLPGTGDYTIEWFQYMTSIPSHPRVFSIGPDTGATLGVSIEGGNLYTWPNVNSWTIGTTLLNTWVYFALVRTSAQTRLYVNGSEVGTAQTDTTNVSGSSKDLYIGADGLTAGDGFPGNITNFRWTNSSIYSSNFSRPTSPLKILPQTKLLLLGGSAANPVVDATGINVLTNFNTTWSSATPF